jgi:cell wall-associated NlpC family hydrolase
MVIRLFIATLFLYGTYLSADAQKHESSLFLEYEREISHQSDPTMDQENPFKKIVTKLTPTKPKTPYVPTPVQPVAVTTTTPIEKPPIGHDDLPYLVINKPVDTTPVCKDNSYDKKVEKSSSNEPKKTLIQNITSKKDKILAKAKEFLGTPYGFGRTDGSVTDCSGFTQQVFRQFGVSLPRSAAEQARLGTEVDSKDLQVGDLLFYQTYKNEPSHVAIYVGGGQIIHASYKGKKVQYDTIDKEYYKQRFMYAKRLALGDQDSSSE